MNEQEILTPELYEAVITWEDGEQTVSPPMSERAAQDWLTRWLAEVDDPAAAGWTVRPSSQMRLV